MRRFFTENALYWLLEYRFDGLRFDAVHAISEADWLDEMAAEVRATVEPGRHVHLVLEHDGNASEHLRRGFDAQWNDDAHHVLHVLLTGECDGYYADYADGAGRQAGALPGPGLRLSGRALGLSRAASRAARPAATSPPTAFVLFLQNHDQIGNRPFGDRLTGRVDPEALEAAIALQLLCPQIPLIFMGEEAASAHALPLSSPTITASWPRPCARGGGASSRASRDSRPARPRTRSPIRMRRKPSTAAGPRRTASRAPAGRHSTGSCWRCAPRVLVPRLGGATSMAAHAVGRAGAVARWRLGDGSVLTIACNLARDSCPVERPDGRLLFASRAGAGEQASHGRLEGLATVAFLDSTQ